MTWIHPSSVRNTGLLYLLSTYPRLVIKYKSQLHLCMT